MLTEWENWAEDATDYFKSAFGLAGGFARQSARLYILLHQNGLEPRITSGFRDPAKQKRMRDLWDAGQRAGLRARPATYSKHIITNWIGQPAATAIDIVSNDEQKAARLAQTLGLGIGLYFGTPDPGHYFAT